MKQSLRLLFAFCLLFGIFFSLLPSPAAAQTTGCWITKIGNPSGPSPTFPPECQSGIFTPTGVISPPNLKCFSVSGGQYCEMPISPKHPNGTDYYKHTGKKWGSKEMIDVLYTVAQNWKINHPTGYLIINDISAPICPPYCHKTHAWGTAADVLATATGQDCVADNVHDRCKTSPGTYNPPGTLELGRLFMNTGIVRQIIYWDKKTAVISQLKSYANTKGTNIAELSDHPNHFHIDIRRAHLPYCGSTNPRAC